MSIIIECQLSAEKKLYAQYMNYWHW